MAVSALGPDVSKRHEHLHSTNALACAKARSNENWLSAHVKYSVKIKSKSLLLLPFAAMIAGYVVPFQNWVQIALMGVATGVVAGFAGRNNVVRSFEPADAPLASKRKMVAGFALARLVFGLFLIVLGALVLPDVLAPLFLTLGGYLIGTTAATPISSAELEAMGRSRDDIDG